MKEIQERFGLSGLLKGTSLPSNSSKLMDLLNSGLWWIAFILPVGVYLFYVWRYSVNIPYWDDFDALLNFANMFVSTNSFWDRVGLVFAQHNENRVVFSRILLLVQYYGLGILNFRNLIIFGNLGWISLTFVMALIAKCRLKLPAIYLLPLPYLLLTFSHWETMFFPMASTQFYWALFFSIIFLLCLSEKRVLCISIFFPAALFTSAAAITLYPLGNLYLAFTRNWKGLLIFSLSSSAVTLAYFYHFHVSPQLPGMLKSLMNFEAAITYFFVFLGNVVQLQQTSLILGFSGVIAFAILMLYGPSNDFLLLVGLFILLIAGTGSLNRSGFGIDQALASRYSTYILIFFVNLYLWAALYLHKYDQNNKFGWVAIIVSLLFFWGYLFKFEISEHFARQQAVRIMGITGYIQGDAEQLTAIYPDKERAVQLLTRAEELHLYDGKDQVELLHPISTSLSDLTSNSEMSKEVDFYDGTRIVGWALIPGEVAQKSETFIVFVDENTDTVYKLKTIRIQRPDVSKAFNVQFQYDGAGFEAFLTNYKIPPGTYKVGFYIDNHDKYALSLGNQEFIVP